MWGIFENNTIQCKLGLCNEAIHINFRELRKATKKPDPRYRAIVCSLGNLYVSSTFMRQKSQNRKYVESHQLTRYYRILNSYKIHFAMETLKQMYPH